MVTELLEWVNRWWPIRFGSHATFGSTFKFGGKRFEE